MATVLSSGGKLVVDSSGSCMVSGEVAPDNPTELFPNYHHTGLVVNDTPGDAGKLHVAFLPPASASAKTGFRIRLYPELTQNEDKIEVIIINNNDPFMGAGVYTWLSGFVPVGDGEYQIPANSFQSIETQSGLTDVSYVYQITVGENSTTYTGSNKYILIKGDGYSESFAAAPSDAQIMNESVSARVYLGDAAVGTMGTPPDIDYVGYTNASWTWTPPASGSATVLHLGFPWMVPQGGGAPLPYAGAVQCFVIHPVITANQWVEIPTVNHDQFQHSTNYNNQYVSSIYIPSTFDISSVSYSIPNDFVALKFVVDGHELKLPGTGW